MSSAHALLRYIGVLSVAFVALQGAWSICRGGGLDRWVIERLTVQPASALINVITPEEQVAAVGPALVNSSVRMSVLNGCEGLDVLFLAWAALAAARRPWRAKLIGAAWGSVLIYALNQGRIAALFYSARFDRAWFDVLHGYLAPTFIVVIASVFYGWWYAQSAPSQSSPR